MKRKIPTFTIDLKKIHPYESSSKFESKIIGELEKRALYGKDFIYTIIDGERTQQFKEQGTYRPDNLIYGFTQKGLIWTSDNDSDQTLSCYVKEYNLAGLAIWDGNQLDEVYEVAWRFKNFDSRHQAIAGVAKIKVAA